MEITYIYGAGSLSKHLLQLCRKTGIEVTAIVDPKKVGSVFDGLAVIDVEDIQKNSKVLIGVLNNFVSMSHVVQRLQTAGVETILTPPEVFFDLGARGVDSEWYWLSTNKSNVLKMADEARALLFPFFDGKSVSTLESILNYRCFGLIDESNVLNLEEQYFNTGIPEFWSGEVNLIDGGAFDGDTILAALKFGVNLKEVFAFEPDPANYEKLKFNTEKINLRIHPFLAGLSEANGVATFNFTSGTGSSIVENGGADNTDLIYFDSLKTETSISHIKLDVEGAELSALEGMKETIKRDTPKLAISVYHKPEDIVELTRFVMKFEGYNNYSLRNYAHQSFETILYACN